MEESRLTDLRRYFEERPEQGVAAVYLFGSHAAGREHRESDVDLGILLLRDRYPEAGDRFEARVRLTSELIHVLRQNEVDVVILNDAPPLLGRRIVYEGIPLFVGDAEAHRIYVRDVQIRAADLEPYLRKWERVLLESLAR
jgi:predicted nucleotidyltransferase